MRTLYLDCFAGASGDMLIGALLDCGLDFEILRRELAKLGVEGYDLSVKRVDRSGISATKFDVHLHAEAHTHEHHHDHTHHDHDHDHHDHHHGHELAHNEPHSHTHTHTSHEHAHRSLSEIKRLIQTSSLDAAIKQRAQAIFQRIGEAEAKIHNIPVEQVHFHEVGAVDSIVDIIGVCIGLQALGIERIISSPLHVGSGTFTCAHGTYPVPGPAAAELLRGVPSYAKDIVGELVTPTGAGIIATLASEFGPQPLMRAERIGYGAGTREYPKFPNVLRAVIGELETDTTPTTVTVIEANIDDLNAQVFGYLMETALAAGALDIFYTPVQMKKNRPGVLLTLLCAPEDRERMAALIFRETTTLGVRYRDERREVLSREHVEVKTPYGPIKIKVARARDGRVINYAPEFEDCRAAAEQCQVAVREVQTAALVAYAGVGELPKN